MNAFAIASVLLPLLAMVLWAISVEIKSDGGVVKRVSIVGYDPVDLLSGHYLVYRYDLGPLKICDDVPNRMNVCVCVSEHPRDNGPILADRKVECNLAAKSCDLHIQGSCQYSTFLTSSERFYFPESYSQILARVPVDSQAEISIQNDGTIRLRNIFVRDQPILEWAKERVNLKALRP
jgi:hypothetical protein